MEASQNSPEQTRPPRRLGPSHYEATEKEKVLETVAQHWTAIIPAVLFLCGIALIPYGMERFSIRADLIHVTRLAAMAVTVIAILLFVVMWRVPRLTVTNQRVICVHGLLRRTTRETPISQIMNVSASQDLLERVFGIGTLTLDLAGGVGSETLDGIARPRKLEELLIREIDKYEAEVAHEGPPFDAVEELFRLHSLLKEGVIDNEEFQQTKRHLLARL